MTTLTTLTESDAHAITIAGIVVVVVAVVVEITEVVAVVVIRRPKRFTDHFPYIELIIN